MSVQDKLLEKIRNNPKNVRLNELVRLMDGFGFNNRRTKDAYFFYHEKLKNETYIPRVAIPHGKEKKVRECYVELCLEAIERLESLK